jgi:hypothetical protein
MMKVLTEPSVRSPSVQGFSRAEAIDESTLKRANVKWFGFSSAKSAGL